MNLTEKWNVFKNGKHISDWACDIGYTGRIESNGSKEWLFKYEDEFYLLRTTWDKKRILSGSKINKKEELKEGGFIADLIKENL